MKTEEQIRSKLEQVYEHRFNLRLERKMKKCCKNCKYGISKEFDLGDFGSIGKWECKDGKICSEYCGFICNTTQQQIQNQMIQDISDPSICGAKQPKIAMLLWMLHEDKQEYDNLSSSLQKQNKQVIEQLSHDDENINNKVSLFDRIKDLFSK